MDMDYRPTNIAPLSETMTNPHFYERYRELAEREELVIDGSIKMVHSFYMETPYDMPNPELVNTPRNLDYAVRNEFCDFCESYGFGEIESATQLAFAFGAYMKQHHNMRFYIDLQPDLPNRNFTLKKDLNGVQLSLYPLEYSLKVVAGERKFEDVINQLVEQEKNAPSVDAYLDQFLR